MDRRADIWAFAGATTPAPAQGLVTSPADEYSAELSPDGRWLAYQGNNTNRYEIYVQSMTGSGRWQLSTTGGEEPHWSPDGKRVIYRYDDELYEVSVDTAAGFSHGAPRLLFRGVFNLRSDTGMSFDVDPKTGRFLMVRPAVDTRTRQTVRVVVNWFDELQAKFGPAR